jgi:hypothetical protein
MDHSTWQELIDQLRGAKISVGQDAAGYVRWD